MNINSKLVKLLIFFLFFKSNTVFSQARLQRTNFKNEVFVAAHITGVRSHIYGVGYEFTLFKKGKKDFFTLQNEITTSILPRFGTDGSRLQTLLKWNRQSKSIISLGLGSSYRINNSYTRYNFLFNNSYKYCFDKIKTTLSGNLFLIVSPLKPHVGNITGPICVSDCPKWGYMWQFSANVGKYF